MRSTVLSPAEQHRRSVVVGTAGHIDHGKTALVRALTGIDTDRLPEEKARGITIDLGFASLELADASGQSYDVSLIDVPGHHAFIRNMLAGAGGIDCMMLVVAANEGVQAQTLEHLAICTLLDVRHGLVVLTKADAASPDRLQTVQHEVVELLRKTAFAGAPILAASAHTGQGLPELKRALTDLVARVEQRNVNAITRLPLDRVFSVRGFGTVVTGTLQAGGMRVEDTLELQPAGRAVRVRGVQVHGKACTEAHAPNRVAVNVAGLDVAEIQRGDMLVPAGTLGPTRTVDVELVALPGAPPLRHRARARVHAFTAETLATVLLYQQTAVTGTETEGKPVLARLRLTKPMVLAPGDRFVVRQLSPAQTLAGGLVLDAQPLPYERKAAAQAWLERLRTAAPAERLAMRVGRRGVGGIALSALVRESGLTRDAVRTLLKPFLDAGALLSVGKADSAGDNLLSRKALGDAMELVLKALAESRGAPVPRAELRSRTRLEAWVFELAAARMIADRRIEWGPNGLLLPGSSTGSEAAQTARMERVEELYRSAGLHAPIASEAMAKLGIAPGELRRALTLLLRAGKLVRLGSDDLLVHRSAVDGLTTALQRLRGERFDVARFKEFTKLTRKHAIPLLEYLDGARVTRNDRGTRVVL